MEEKIPIHKITTLENMIINILSEGEKEVYSYIESIKCPFRRFNERNLFFEAKEKINKNHL